MICLKLNAGILAAAANVPFAPAKPSGNQEYLYAITPTPSPEWKTLFLKLRPFAPIIFLADGHNFRTGQLPFRDSWASLIGYA